MYEHVSRNRWRSALLVLVVLAVAVGLGFLLGYLFEAGVVGAVIALAIALGMSLISFRYGDRMVLAVTGAKPASPEEYPRLHNIAEGLSIAAGAPKPRLYVIPEQAPNAFATGRDPEHSSIAVTEGLLEITNRVELEGVMAHELSHITNRDMLVNMLVATLVGVIALLAGFMRRAFFWGGVRGRGRGGGPAAPLLLILGVVLALLAPVIGQLIRLAVSRRREYLADASGALLTRYPPGLASALRKIAAAPNTMRRAANEATSHLWLSQPSYAVGEGVSRFERLFSTHPPIQERIRILEDM